MYNIKKDQELHLLTHWQEWISGNRKQDRYKCTWCWVEIQDTWVWFYPLYHNIDIWEKYLYTCWLFKLIKKI